MLQNEFDENSALIESNVLNLRSATDGVDNVLRTNFRGFADLQCGGFSVRLNNISNSVGCRYTNGAVYAYCFDQKDLGSKD